MVLLRVGVVTERLGTSIVHLHIVDVERSDAARHREVPLALVLFRLHPHRSLTVDGVVAVERRMRHRAQRTRERAVRRAVCEVVLRLALLLMVLVLALGLRLGASSSSEERFQLGVP